MSHMVGRESKVTSHQEIQWDLLPQLLATKVTCCLIRDSIPSLRDGGSVALKDPRSRLISQQEGPSPSVTSHRFLLEQICGFEI